MRLATWNVNSIRAREERLLRWLDRARPDVACLQETKVQDEGFPFDSLRSAGYQAVVFGQKTYNGVAILTRNDVEVVTRGFEDGAEDPQARFLVARCEGVTVASTYVPNGGEVGSEKWAYKLEWLRRLRVWLEGHCRATEPFALCGDMNVAPEARDVCDPAGWESTVLFHPMARAALEEVRSFGLVDAFRQVRSEAGLYTWWDYRTLAFPRDQGLRIDHVFATETLAARARSATIDRDERKGEKPSDHAPVVIDFD